LLELEAAARLLMAVFFALDDAAVAGQGNRLLRSFLWKVSSYKSSARLMPKRTAPAWPESPPPTTVQVMSKLPIAVDGGEGLVDNHAQHRPREIDFQRLAVDGDFAAAALDPTARDGVFAPSGAVSDKFRRAGGAFSLPL